MMRLVLVLAVCPCVVSKFLAPNRKSLIATSGEVLAPFGNMGLADLLNFKGLGEASKKAKPAAKDDPKVKKTVAQIEMEGLEQMMSGYQGFAKELMGAAVAASEPVKADKKLSQNELEAKENTHKMMKIYQGFMGDLFGELDAHMGKGKKLSKEEQRQMALDRQRRSNELMTNSQQVLRDMMAGALKQKKTQNAKDGGKLTSAQTRLNDLEAQVQKQRELVTAENRLAELEKAAAEQKKLVKKATEEQKEVQKAATKVKVQKVETKVKVESAAPVKVPDSKTSKADLYKAIQKQQAEENK